MLRFTPIYGWGWRRGGEAVDEPPPFSIDATADDRIEGSPEESDHLLAGMWLELTVRSPEAPASYNVRAFRVRGDGEPALTGFAALLP